MSEAELSNRIARLEARFAELSTRERLATVKPWAPLGGGVVYVDSSGTGALKTETAFLYDEATDELAVGRVRLTEQATPSTPANPYSLLFADSTGIISSVNDAGVVRQMVRYLEGTWTPVLAGSGTAGTFTYTASNTGGDYTRIGNTVFFRGAIRISAISVAPTGNMSVTGLPIAAVTTGWAVVGGAVIFNYTGIDFPAGYAQLAGQIDDAGQSMALIRAGDNIISARVQGAEITVAPGLFDIRFEGFYRVAS